MQSLVFTVNRSLATILNEAAASTASDVRRQIKDLQKTLKLITAVLEDADRRRMQDKTIQLWSKELKEIMYDVEDLMDLYSLELLPPPGQQPPVCCHRFSVFSFCASFPRRHEIAIGIREINHRLQKIAKDRATYQLHRSDSKSIETVIHPRTSSILPTNIVGAGIEEDMRELSSFLLNPQKQGNGLLAITGIGGIGKTTLAQKIYNDPQIKQHFDTLLWVHVSQHFNETDLMRGMLSDAGYSADTWVTRHKLESILSSLVDGKRVLIVLDDVWSADVWEHVLQNPLKSAAPNTIILITTRDEDIAKRIGALPIHHVRPLGLEDSWSLLCKIVGEDQEEMEYIRDIGMKIIAKCEGLPIALKSIGATLRIKKRSRSEWSMVLDYLKSTWNGFDKDYMSALNMSYDALPSSTKPCFLYCSLLPQNTIISSQELMQMWISEGFVELNPSDGVPEDLAEAHYAKIVASNLLQQQSDSRDCRIHDLIRDLAIILAQDDNFYSRELGKLDNTETRLRRLLIGSREIELTPDVIKIQKGLRSLLIFGNPLLDTKLLKDVLHCLKHLRVLDLRGTSVEEVPDSLGELFHLRYLNLSHTRIRLLPHSIRKLKNLLFLNLRGCMDLQRLPSGVTRLKKLRSLDLLHTNLDLMPNGVGEMKDLNTLLGYMGRSSSLEELKDLEQIRYLNINKLDTAVGFAELLLNKKNLRSLVLSWELVPSTAEDVQAEGLRPPACLEQLTMEWYPSLEYPKWIMSFTSGYPNLVDLNLKSCIFSTSLPPLGQLPKLKNLRITASNGVVTIDNEFYGHIVCPFPKLERLVIEEMDSLEEWCRTEDAFPVLRELQLERCPKLRSLPHCLQLSTALTKLLIEAVDSIRVIEDLLYVTELHIEDCPNLERISSLTKLKTLKIIRCPLLQDVANVKAVQHLKYEDFALETLPGWLEADNMMNLRTLEITGNRILLKNLQIDGSERDKISSIPHVYTGSP